jgi:nucleoside-diphosphate kinase
VLLKPDAVQRGLVGRILTRFEEKGLKVVALKLQRFPVELIERHYEEHRKKPFFADLVGFMTSGPAVALVLEGKGAIEITRRLMGETSAAKAAPGTIRGDFGMSFSNNLVHGSDGPASAEREIAHFFPDKRELCEWTPAQQGWIYSSEELGAKKDAAQAKAPVAHAKT